MRVISLLPSATEIVSALGLGERLVGRSHECDFPLGVEELPVLTESKVHGAVGSEEIHRRVDTILREDISVYRVDAELLRELAPTHVVTQVQCDVCAVSLRDVEAAVAGWSGGKASPRIVALNPSSLADVHADFRRTAAALGVVAEGEALIESMQREMDAIARVARGIEPKPRVVTIEWIAPLMTGGNWMPELIEMGGGINLFGRAGEHSPWIEWSRIVEADPDFILVLPCGFGLDLIRRDLHLLTNLPGWQELRAVREKRVYLTDGNQYFNRPGPRLVDSLQIVAEILHPDRFHFGFEGSGWERL